LSVFDATKQELWSVVTQRGQLKLNRYSILLNLPGTISSISNDNY